MKALSAGMATALGNDTLTLCMIFDVVPAIGDPIYLTDADTPLVIGGKTYRNDIGFDASSVSIQTGTSGSSVAVTVVLQDDGPFTRAAILTGTFDNAKATIALADYAAVGNGALPLYVGRIEQINFTEEASAEISVVSILDQYTNVCNDLVCYTCRADLGDAKCKVDLTGLSKTFTITAATNRQILTTDLTSDDGAFDDGLVAFTTSDNAGYPIEVGTYVKTDGTIVLKLPAPYPIPAGTTGVVYPGCDKLIQTCHDKYSNVLNFRGEAVGISPITSATQSLLPTLADDLPAGTYPPGYAAYWYDPTHPSVHGASIGGSPAIVAPTVAEVQANGTLIYALPPSSTNVPTPPEAGLELIVLDPGVSKSVYKNAVYLWAKPASDSYVQNYLAPPLGQVGLYPGEYVYTDVYLRSS